VLTGKVVERGDRLLISAELVDARDNTHLWGDQYNRSLTEILATQEEISKEISEKLRLRLTGEERRRLARHHTESAEAYQLYLKGRYHWNRRTAEGITKSIDYFQQAIVMDPGYALSYAGLADAYALLPLNVNVPAKEALPKAKAAAARALEIDETLAEAHASLGYVKYQLDWDWAGAEREFRRAIELNPNYVTAHHWYSNFLSGMGRHAEAMAEMKKAQELEPLSLVINAGVAWAFLYERQYDQAIEQFRKTLELDPNFNRAHTGLGLIYEQKGMHKEAIAALQKARELSGSSPLIVAFLGHAYATAGKRSEARAVVNELKELSARGQISPYYIAMIHAGLGERDQALQWLEKAFQDRSSGLVWLKVHPVWDQLRSDPRFTDLIRRLRVPAHPQ
ncbi:MAG: tetratricopeptide repeat protein, partial [Acidobacteria bacterium]|nr:tetratricopeptide repeat protein [Acidobacteriota bacterium]